VLDKGSLVLEGVTLGKVVELVVQVLVDLAGSTVLDEETAEDPLAAHPQDLPIEVGKTLCQLVSMSTGNNVPSSCLRASRGKVRERQRERVCEGRGR